ncbi:hypothetical protein GGI24_005696, partial [Coemansia furcata]
IRPDTSARTLASDRIVVHILGAGSDSLGPMSSLDTCAFTKAHRLRGARHEALGNAPFEGLILVVALRILAHLPVGYPLP